MFCPKCGSLLLPKKIDGKRVMACSSCSYVSKDLEKSRIIEKIVKEREVDVVEGDESEHLPITEAECPKCGNKKAYYWLVQTRSGDEPETKFLKCTKCKHIWRDYN